MPLGHKSIALELRYTASDTRLLMYVCLHGRVHTCVCVHTCVYQVYILFYASIDPGASAFQEVYCWKRPGLPFTES